MEHQHYHEFMVPKQTVRYEVFVDDVVVGWSALERGDPAMGVVLGQLYPNEAYVRVRPGSTFRVRAPDGLFLEPAQEVVVEDYSAELGADAIELSILGLDEAQYRKYFDEHVRKYDENCRLP